MSDAFDLSDYYILFKNEALGYLENITSWLESFVPGQCSTEQIRLIFNDAHTLKGTSGMMGFADFGQVSVALEELIHTIACDENVSDDDKKCALWLCEQLENFCQYLAIGIVRPLDIDTIVMRLQGIGKKL